MPKKRSKAAPGQKGLTKEFVTVPRQTRLPFEPVAGNNPARGYKPFVPAPNPELENFVDQSARPCDPNHDDYDVPAFDRDIVVDKFLSPKAIYDMHTYWSKKHWAAIRAYIRHYLPIKHRSRNYCQVWGTSV